MSLTFIATTNDINLVMLEECPQSSSSLPQVLWILNCLNSLRHTSNKCSAFLLEGFWQLTQCWQTRKRMDLTTDDNLSGKKSELALSSLSEETAYWQKIRQLLCVAMIHVALTDLHPWAAMDWLWRDRKEDLVLNLVLTLYGF